MCDWDSGSLREEALRFDEHCWRKYLTFRTCGAPLGWTSNTVHPFLDVISLRDLDCTIHLLPFVLLLSLLFLVFGLSWV